MFYLVEKRLHLRTVSLGIAAGGLLRLLLPAHPYSVCAGGATLLKTYTARNLTNVYTLDYVEFWQVCHS